VSASRDSSVRQRRFFNVREHAELEKALPGLPHRPQRTALRDLDQFVHDELTYNDKPMTRRQYRDMIARDVAASPDLVFDVGTLVVAGDQVACRLMFNCTPEHEFLGYAPSGKRIAFTEHVFYRFRDGRIANVQSLIDR
jgi:predicted ester cyclase